MVSLERLLISPVLVGLTVGATLAVYWDATRQGFTNPRRWALLVFLTTAIGFGSILLVPSAPVPGLLVVVLIGPVLYLFERDDAKHGDEPADPHVLPGEPTGDGSTTQTEREPAEASDEQSETESAKPDER